MVNVVLYALQVSTHWKLEPLCVKGVLIMLNALEAQPSLWMKDTGESHEIVLRFMSAMSPINVWEMMVPQRNLINAS